MRTSTLRLVGIIALTAYGSGVRAHDGTDRPTGTEHHRPAALAAVSGSAGERRVLHPDVDPPFGRADAVVDLATREGARLVAGAWRYQTARLVESTVRAPADPPLQVRGLALEPVPGGTGFESGWQSFAPEELTTRRAASQVSFGWYRLSFTLPEQVAGVDLRGATVALELVVDDYAEVWVDGRFAPQLGQRGGAIVAGWNAPNRVVLTDAARPGRAIDVAILAVNGPLSARPDNFVWVRSAALDIYRPRTDQPASHGRIERLDAGLDRVVARDAVIEQVATGFEFTEGPVWSEGGLLFSDPNANVIYRYEPQGRLYVYRVKSGYGGADIARYHQPGSNGLAIDDAGRLTIDQHGNRRVVRVEKNGAVSVLADRYRGKRLNSPNDLVYRSDGTLYFTDPPFGLPEVYADPAKELDFSGVFKWDNGKLELLTSELRGPNGLAFSPDELFLYVGNWDPKRKVVMRYELNAEGTVASSSTFYDITSTAGDEAIDGLDVDERGNVYVAAPGGVHIVSPEGKHIGTIVADEEPHNITFGDADGRTLYMTALTSVYRVRLQVRGAAKRH